jgi:hypothetical protein
MINRKSRAETKTACNDRKTLDYAAAHDRSENNTPIMPSSLVITKPLYLTHKEWRESLISIEPFSCKRVL